MSATPVTLIGAVTYDNGTTQNVTFQGVAAITGLSVGGGPIFGSGGEPSHPIVPPGGYPEPGHPIVPPGGYPHPEHPIVIPPEDPGPPEGGAPPDNPTEDKPPPEGGGGWGWWASQSAWVYEPKAGVEASPKAAQPQGRGGRHR